MCRDYIKLKEDNSIFQNYDLGLFILQLFHLLNLSRMKFNVKFEIKFLQMSKSLQTVRKSLSTTYFYKLLEIIPKIYLLYNNISSCLFLE